MICRVRDSVRTGSCGNVGIRVKWAAASVDAAQSPVSRAGRVLDVSVAVVEVGLEHQPRVSHRPVRDLVGLPIEQLFFTVNRFAVVRRYLLDDVAEVPAVVEDGVARVPVPLADIGAGQEEDRSAAHLRQVGFVEFLELVGVVGTVPVVERRRRQEPLRLALHQPLHQFDDKEAGNSPGQ
ncbi:hypothetical protein ACWCXH_23860 [Kitasatospora sp. NPDC001660]